MKICHPLFGLKALASLVWQPIFYPNFLYCSHCYKIRHSFENCYKRKKNKGPNGKQALQSQGPPNSTHSAANKIVRPQRQNTWQTQRAKLQVYRPIVDLNVNNASTSGSKDSQGNEIQDRSPAAGMTITNSFNLLSMVDDDVIEGEKGDCNTLKQNHLEEEVVVEPPKSGFHIGQFKIVFQNTM
ncbi:hypothetical protein FRX31_014546 [Thalictrum thalictroides]|uniref:Uncharacterized protein n=1 Tax=Thalictrum thalictroides TaxID=46969 RepID=A0A7J6WG28_THATH|nr:hypothetical protein FRX31_014546 [Thalictrum thalictroides]